MSTRDTVFLGPFMGVLLGFSVDRFIEWLQNRNRKIKFLKDSRNEIKENRDRLKGSGSRMITDVWDSGASIGMMQLLTSEQTQLLSKTYHRIKANHAEAVICRDAAEHYRSLPNGPLKKQAALRWENLTCDLKKREENLKTALTELIEDKAFWKPLSINSK